MIYAINLIAGFRKGSLFYWCTGVSTLLMISLVLLVWFKKIWDYVMPSHEADSNVTTPPANRILKALYDFSFDIMSNALGRTIMYTFVVIITVVASLIHLVRHSLLTERKLQSIQDVCFHSWSAARNSQSMVVPWRITSIQSAFIHG